ncbi:GNAT family N-acetyltransferase [Paenibacillaceae bacterium]|nr:GNAT family N-acetyltransferase [Paenibacillaceae bacterium]
MNATALDEIVVTNATELNEEQMEQLVSLFVSGFMHDFEKYFRVKPAAIKSAIRHSFIAEHYYAALLDTKVAGIVAVSTNYRRSHEFDKKILQREFGRVKGALAASQLRKELEQPLEQLQYNQGYIECVTTHTSARGKGVASQLLNHVMKTLNYDEYILEVIDTNVGAIRLYEKLGFTLFRRQKAELFLRMNGIKERLFMKAGPL